MEFWRGNKLDARFDETPAEVADEFFEWAVEEYGVEAGQLQGFDGSVERVLRWWLTSEDHFNSVWEKEVGSDSFEELLDLVIGKIYGRSS